MSQFTIGDTVFVASYDYVERKIPCPDCGGTKRLRVILATEEVSIECGGCDPGGYRPSTGLVSQFEYQTVVRTRKVTAVVECFGKPTEYRLDDTAGHYYIGREGEVFAAADEAIAYGESLRAEREAERNRQALSKTHDKKSWAWNASYHRREAKRCREQAAWHEAKVIVCQAKARG